MFSLEFPGSQPRPRRHPEETLLPLQVCPGLLSWGQGLPARSLAAIVPGVSGQRSAGRQLTACWGGPAGSTALFPYCGILAEGPHFLSLSIPPPYHLSRGVGFQWQRVNGE